MIGHERITELRQAGTVKSITIIVGHGEPYRSRIAFDDYDHAHVVPKPLEIVDPEFPTVFTEKTEPGPLDLRWLFFAPVVFAIAKDCSDAFFYRWLDAIREQRPRWLSALNPQEQMITWPE